MPNKSTYMEMQNQPLVSVAVITYNSSKTVSETLDSIYNQTYRNLELVISDDGSNDSTIEICQKWINNHKDRFVRTKIITVDKNTGVTCNYKRASENCQGEWIKEIDGDDLLLPNCLELYMQYVNAHPETIYLFGKVEVFGENINIVNHFTNTIFDYSFFNLSQEEQYKWLVTRSFQPIASVTSFFNREKILELGIIYDTRIPMLEDWPRWIRLIEHGIELNFIDQVIARYRVSGNASICSGTMYSDSFQRSLALMYIYYQYEPAKLYVGKFKAWIKYAKCQKILSNKIYWRLLYTSIRIAILPKKIMRKLCQ
jgi:alpha-1,3-rhamnosyltransferase